MDQALPCQDSDLQKLDSGELQHKVDFFRKLGYSSKDVKAALKKLDLDTDTNSVLGELVRTGFKTVPCISNSDNDERSTGQKHSLLPLSWTSGPCRNLSEAVHKKNTDEELRPIVIDGSNVAMSHGNKATFSCRGIQLAVNYFLERGHNNIKVFVPSWRKEQPRPDTPIRDQHILSELENQKIVVFTPSRHVGGKRVVCYDDRFIVKLAHESEGVIVSNDTYRDLQGEKPEWKKCIEERLLMYSFVNDRFMPPDDPLGRHGPNLDNFLRRKPLPIEQRRPLCPYDKKCTYGIKCKFYHPERTNQSYLSLADELREKAQISSSQDEPNARLSPKQLQSDADSFSSCQVSENIPLYRDAPGSSQNHVQVSGEHCQNEWAGPHHLPSHYYATISQDYLDSGLGSYDSLYSEAPQNLSNSHRLWPQQQSASTGSRHASVHLEKNNMSQSCHCSSYAVPLSTGQQQVRKLNMEYKEQPKYDAYPYPHNIPQQHSLPIPLQYNGTPHLQQNYWSDPFQGLPQDRTRCSLPIPAHSLQPNNLYNHYNPLVQLPSFGTSDPKRLELRQRLQAIFNPYEVDRAMEMFPDLMDAEKLAAEIFNLKAQRGKFYVKP